MNNFTTEHTASATWSVLRKPDSPAYSLVYGYGYVANDSRYDAEAVAEGWEVLATGLVPEIAVRMRDIYKAAGKVATATPDMSDLGLEHDYTEYVEDRDSSTAQIFDTIYTPVIDLDETDEDTRSAIRGALWVEGVITDIDEDTIELDGYMLVDRRIAEKYGEIICKAVADCGFITEYGAYLDRLQENKDSLYAVAVQTERATHNGMVA